jgi:hypothetical protein
VRITGRHFNVVLVADSSSLAHAEMYLYLVLAALSSADSRFDLYEDGCLRYRTGTRLFPAFAETGHEGGVRVKSSRQLTGDEVKYDRTSEHLSATGKYALLYYTAFATELLIW